MTGITIAGFPQRAQVFENHWRETNAARNGSPVVLSGGYGVERLQGDRESYLRLSEAIIALENSEREQQNQVNTLREPARERISQLRAMVDAFLAGTLYIKQLPQCPNKLSGQSVYRSACNDAAEVWGRIDSDKRLGIAIPFLLPGNIGRAQLVTDAAALMAAWDRLVQIRQQLQKARTERDAILKATPTRFTQYRKAVRAVLPTGHALLVTLPK